MRVQLDPGDQFFTVLLVWNTGDLNFGYGRMGIEEFLNLFRVDVLATANHHVLDTTHDLNVALVIHGGQITGMHPAGFVDRFSGCLFVVPVFQHDAVTACAQLADFTARHDLAAARIHNLGFQVWLGTAHGGYALFNAVVGAGLGRYRAGFSHAIGDLNFLHVHLVDHLLHHLGIAVTGLGHAHPAVTRAISEQAAKLVHCSNIYTIPQQTELAAK